jgi:hypothetical protein
VNINKRGKTRNGLAFTHGMPEATCGFDKEGLKQARFMSLLVF